MSIRNQQIGWSQESKLWWEVLKGFNKLEQTIAGQMGSPLLVDNSQIGWKNEEYLLREIAKKVAAITSLKCDGPCPTTTTTTTTIPVVFRCSSQEQFNGIMEKSWNDAQSPNPPDGIYSFEIIDLTLDGVQYGTGQTITITSPDDLIIGLGLNGITPYVMNINDWLNSITGVAASGFVFHDDMTTIDSPVLTSTYSVIIKRTTVRTSDVYYYAWVNDGVDAGWGFGGTSGAAASSVCYRQCWACANT